MPRSNDKEKTKEQIKAVLITAVVKKIRLSKPEELVTAKTRLKTDAEIDVFDFGDILVYFFSETEWMIRYKILIEWFAKTDCSIEELADKILSLQKLNKEKAKKV